MIPEWSYWSIINPKVLYTGCLPECGLLRDFAKLNEISVGTQERNKILSVLPALFLISLYSCAFF